MKAKSGQSAKNVPPREVVDLKCGGPRGGVGGVAGASGRGRGGN